MKSGAGFYLLITFLLAMAVNHVFASEIDKHKYAWNLTFENDLFFGSDRFYTNGVQLEVSRLWKTGEYVVGPVLGALCSKLGCGGQSLLTSSHKVGQLMYTPEDISNPNPQPQDRPWAGMLYYAQDYDFLSSDKKMLTTFTGQVGIVGPYSYVEETQKYIHETFHATIPQGWDNQIDGELGIMAIVERRSNIDKLSHSFSDGNNFVSTGFWRVALGNIMTFAGAGLSLSFGKDLAPVSERGPGIGVKNFTGVSKSCIFDWLQCSAGASVELRMMFYNVFLDGPVFSAGPSVDRRLLVADGSLKMRLDFPRTRSSLLGPWFMQFTATRRTPEFSSTKTVDSHTFGALTVGTDF